MQCRQQRLLIGNYLGHSLWQVKPTEAVDLREAAALSRTGWPFHLEQAAGERAGIEIGLERKGMHDLAALLPDRLERNERAVRGETGFLVELALRGVQELVVIHQT